MPDAGKTGFHAEAAAVAKLIKFSDFVIGERARADEAHLAAEDIPELGEFVDAGAPDEFAERGDARVLRHFENRAIHFVVLVECRFLLFCIGDHRAEFIHQEFFSVEAGTGLGEEDGTAGSEFDGESDEEEERGDSEDGGGG